MTNKSLYKEFRFSIFVFPRKLTKKKRWHHHRKIKLFFPITFSPPSIYNANYPNQNHHQYPTNSDTHPTSGPDPVGSRRSREFSSLSLAYILVLKSLPDSTLSIAGSSNALLLSQSSNLLSPDRVGVRVGVRGEPGRSMELLGETKHDPREQVVPILALPNCRLRTEEVSSLTELNEPLGDVGGESEGGDIGGEAKMEVGEET